MSEELNLEIETIDANSPYLQTVKKLGRANAKTLGHFPEGAFDQHAEQKHIIVALTPTRKCVGYLLYRAVQRDNVIVIVHLCIAEDYQKKGIAKKIVDYLSKNTQSYYGIRLKCRRDYNLERMWSKLNFTPLNEVKGKNKAGKELTIWWRDHGHPTLFSNNAIQQFETKLFAIIDTNIFFDLYNKNKIQETEFLFADWLESELELCITDEVYKEINTIDNYKERNVKRQFADTFFQLPCKSNDFEEVLLQLQSFCGDKNILPQEILCQLAKTIASDVLIFLTDNQIVLSLAEEIYDNFKLSILTPTALILRLDEIRREAEYQPVRFAGGIKMQLIQNFNSKLLISQFAHQEGDKKEYLAETIRLILAKPDKFKCYVIFQNDKDPLALIAYHRNKINELEIPLFRLKPGTLAPTLAKHLIFRSAVLASQEKRQFTRINDPYLTDVVIESIREDAFFRAKDGYIRANIPVAETAKTLSERIANIGKMDKDYSFCLQLSKTLNKVNLKDEVETPWKIERIFWPGKIVDADIPTFIIPIQAKWAKELFDEDLAQQCLFQEKSDLKMNRELVYYKSKQASRGLKRGLFGRILWYVSTDKNYIGTYQIKACSRLEEVIIDIPENLYKRFRRLGVYNLTDLNKIAKDPKKEIMALRFSNTEIFSNPINLKVVQHILKKEEKFQSPLRIQEESFKIIYCMGNNINI